MFRETGASARLPLALADRLFENVCRFWWHCTRRRMQALALKEIIFAAVPARWLRVNYLSASYGKSLGGVGGLGGREGGEKEGEGTCHVCVFRCE